MVAVDVKATTARLQQLKADRARTRAISMYLKDHRARFEGQWGGCGTKFDKRLELVRMARISFAKLPASLQREYLSRAGGRVVEVNLESPAAGQVVEVSVESKKLTAEVGSVSGSEVKRFRFREKQREPQQQPSGQQLVVVSGSEVREKQGQPQQQPSGQQLVVVSGSSSPPHTPEPRKSVSSTEQPEFNSEPSKPQETESIQEARETVPEQRGPAHPSPAPLHPCQACGVGESGCGSGELKTLLPKCMPRLVKVAGRAEASDIMASAWRFLDRYPKVLQTKDAPSVRMAVLLGVAAKLTQRSDAINVVKVWHAFACKSSEPRIRSLEVEVVSAFGHEGLESQCL